MGMVAALGIASIIFLSVILITAALMMRNQWERLGPRDPGADRHEPLG